MKKTIAIVLVALASAAFGSQAPQVERARAERAKLEHAVERARAERAKLEHAVERARAAKDVKVKRKVVKVNNTLGRGVSSGPARRRK